jgi:hypothetical protein
MTNFKRCWEAATHYETLANGIDYFCDHHAQMRKKQGGVIAAISPNATISHEAKNL